MIKHYLGIDIGGTKVAVTLWDSQNKLIDKLRFEVQPGQTPHDAFAKLSAGGKELLAKHQVSQIESVGISSAGPIDPKAGLIIDAPNLPGWKNVAVVQEFKKNFSAPVYLENDANAAALAEWKFGAGQGHDSMVYITLSTGIGGGLIFNSQLWAGATGNAGEIGHMVIVPEGKLCGCGNKGCWEAYCGGKNVQKDLATIKELPQTQVWQECGGDLTKLQFFHLADSVRKKDAFAQKYLKQWTSYNTMALANLMYAYDPEVIVLGTIAFYHGELFLEDLISQVKARVWPVYQRNLKIVPTKLGEKIGDYAALAVALSKS